MEAAAAVRVEKQSLVTQKAPGTDPLEARWAVQCGIRHKVIQAWRAGISQAPFGEFFPVRSFNTNEEFHTVDDNPNLPRETRVTITADAVQEYLYECIGGRDSSGQPRSGAADFGINFGFRGETDSSKMQALSAVILPKLARIREIAQEYNVENPIGDVCPSTDAILGVNRDECPSCWAKWIDSDAFRAYTKAVLARGINVEEYDPKTRTSELRLITFSPNDVSNATHMATAALSTALATLRREWGILLAELDGKDSRKGLDVAQHRMREDLHAPKPADKQVEMIRQMTEANRGGGDNSELMRMLIESQNQTRDLLAAVLGKGSTDSFHVAPDEPEAAVSATQSPVAAMVPPSTGGLPDSVPPRNIEIGDTVHVDGVAGTITEIKSGGWFGVDFGGGQKSLRKQDFD